MVISRMVEPNPDILDGQRVSRVQDDVGLFPILYIDSSTCNRLHSRVWETIGQVYVYTVSSIIEQFLHHKKF
jgi:hypothetical protein